MQERRHTQPEWLKEIESKLSFKTSLMMSFDAAPSAIRTPISCVRCEVAVWSDHSETGVPKVFASGKDKSQKRKA